MAAEITNRMDTTHKTSEKLVYVLVTPARNEAAFIERTIQSMVAQTLRPLRWVIVSDGSTDGTDEIVTRYAAKYDWIELVRMHERKERNFAGKVHAFNAGYTVVRNLKFDLIGNLDADISFDSDYFRFLLGKFVENPKLGVGGTAFKEGSQQYDYRFTSIEHVSGQCQMFRRQCFEEIGGYVPQKGGGIDLVAVLKARMKGWETRTFSEKAFVHHRQMGTAKSGGLMAKFRDGEKDYMLGGHPLWELFRWVYQMSKPPLIIGGCAVLAGYVYSWLSGRRRSVTAGVMVFRRREQMERLKRFIMGKPTLTSHVLEDSSQASTINSTALPKCEQIDACIENISCASEPSLGNSVTWQTGQSKPRDSDSPGPKFPVHPATTDKEVMSHISVCICTYKRQEFLKRLLAELACQETGGLFTYDIVVADNDRFESARPLVEEFARKSKTEVLYCVQPQQNIALTRNKALEHAKGNFIAFIDDDQFPNKDWLLTLYRTCKKYGVDGVLGPVKPHFDEQPPSWVIKGRFCERPTYKTGFIIDWRKGRTGNVLLKRQLFAGLNVAFRPEFLTGEDQDFFRRMIEKDHVFIWCAEAVAYEITPPIRWNLAFMLRRAVFRGEVSIRHSGVKATAVAKSMIALPLYCISLPFLLVVGYHLFVKYLIKVFDHAGRILAFIGFHPIKDSYVTE
jgi:glycosyltransferase involved in cell wall biosynthesis